MHGPWTMLARSASHASVVVGPCLRLPYLCTLPGWSRQLRLPDGTSGCEGWIAGRRVPGALSRMGRRKRQCGFTLSTTNYQPDNQPVRVKDDVSRPFEGGVCVFLNQVVFRCLFPSVTRRRFCFDSKSKFLSNRLITQKKFRNFSSVIVAVYFAARCFSDLKVEIYLVIANS